MQYQDNVVVYQSESQRAIDQYLWNHPEMYTILGAAFLIIVAVFYTCKILKYNKQKNRTNLFFKKSR